MSTIATTLTGPAIARSFTAEDLERATAELKAFAEQPEPIGEWMKGQGFDPEDGCVLVMPLALPQDRGSARYPRYVRFSAFIEMPILIREPRIGPATPSRVSRSDHAI